LRVASKHDTGNLSVLSQAIGTHARQRQLVFGGAKRFKVICVDDIVEDERPQHRGDLTVLATEGTCLLGP
jgi:hypothetical protein